MWSLITTLALGRTLDLGNGLLADQWTSADGLPLDHAKDVAFTPDRHAWVATFEGVLRFDGAHLTPMPDSWVTALGTRRVAALAVDPRDGALWIQAEDRGIARWRDGELRAWTAEELGGPARGLVETATGNWVITTHGALRLAETPQPEPWTAPNNDLGNCVPLPADQALCVADAGVIWRESPDAAPSRLGPDDGVDGWVYSLEIGADGEISAVVGEQIGRAHV